MTQDGLARRDRKAAAITQALLLMLLCDATSFPGPWMRSSLFFPFLLAIMSRRRRMVRASNVAAGKARNEAVDMGR